MFFYGFPLSGVFIAAAPAVAALPGKLSVDKLTGVDIAVGKRHAALPVELPVFQLAIELLAIFPDIRALAFGKTCVELPGIGIA